jgi:hypothetical protein
VKSTRPSDLAAKVLLRLPQEKHDELKARAKAAYRSINGEILMLIDRGIEAEKTASELQA